MTGLRRHSLTLLAVLGLACSPLPPEPKVPPVLPTVTGMILRAEGEIVAEAHGGVATGLLFTFVDEETAQLTVTFLDDQGEEFTPASDFSLGVSVADGGVASVVGQSGWSFRLRGLDDGATSFAVRVDYEGETEYTAPDVDLLVDRRLARLTWSAPDSAQTLIAGGPVSIEVGAMIGETDIASVRFSVNGETIATDVSPPFVATWAPGALSPGIYGIEASAADAAQTPVAADTFYLMVPELDGTFTGTYGGTGDDRVHDLLLLADGSLILAGDVTQPDGGSDGCLIKVSPDGSERWFRAYGGSSGEHLRAVASTPDGGFVACGWTWAEPDRSGPSFWLLRLDAFGGVRWSRVLGESDLYQYAHDLVVNADGGFTVTGGDADGGTLGLLRFDAAGFEVWRRSFPGDPGAAGYALAATADGYIVTGTRQMGSASDALFALRTDEDGNQTWAETYGLGGPLAVGRDVLTRGGGFALLGGGGGDLWFLGLDAAGGEDWSRRYGGADWDQGHAVLATGDGGYLLTGFTTVAGGDRQLFLVKTDAAGLDDAGWQRSYGGVGLDAGHALAEIPGGYLVAGVTDAGAAGGADIRVLAVDASGEPESR